MSSFLSELEQDPFDPKEFVERLAWRATKESSTFDSQTLFEDFEARIRELKDMYETHEKKCERLEMVCKEVEKRHWVKVAELQKKCKHCFYCFQELDEKLDTVAAKVVYLGDQLEGVNTPRARAVEAQNLMKEFTTFFKDDADNRMNSEIDPSQLFEKADVIEKLYKISQKLPNGGKFDGAKKRIEAKYYQIEKDLIEEFFQAQVKDNRARMKEIASILSQFKGYNECKDAFIEKSQVGIFLGVGIFNDIVPLCEKSQLIIQEVFADPDRVMAKFVLNIYRGKLQEYIHNRLNNDKDIPEEFLTTLHDLYSKTVKLSQQLASSKIMGVDLDFLNTLTRTIFDSYLTAYIDTELKTLKNKCELILQRFYDSKNHQKKPIPVGSIQELKRDLQAKIGRANLNLGSISGGINQDYGNETLLSEEVAINLLQETKLALKRCQTLSNPSNAANNATQIFEMQLNYLCIEHIDYALEMGLNAIPTSEPKSQPELHYFEIARQCNAICHLLEKQLVDSLIPLVMSTPKHGECIKRKREVLEGLEVKINNGLERSITAIISWIKIILNTEQKKTDFKPETEDIEMMQTPTCVKVVRFLNLCINKSRDCFDGKNVEALMLEFGTRFHRIVYEHLMQFQYTSLGAMIAICDVNEYRRCASAFRVPLVNQLFDTLHALCNLLVVAPENLKQVCNGETLSGLEKSVLINFVALRADYKSAKLINQFK
ncbi:exocyst complex component 5 [Tetranychus urticae]|uniref:Exocyst complex component 5 n=1 Tax=Tetranychus urticae TaxID=32264 RepID=T1KIH6_TETUR|nr:exocyst complex component 5 [Tetranychus urticae]